VQHQHQARGRICRLLIVAAWGAALGTSPLRGQRPLQWPPAPELARIRYEGSFQRLDDSPVSRSFWRRVLRAVIGPGDSYNMVRPFGISTDPQGRIIVVDTEQRLVHVLDYSRHRYLHLAGSPRERFGSPIGTVVDHEGNVYVSDSLLGKIFVFHANGKFWHYLGDLEGEGRFRRPTGLAFDPDRHLLYLTDTLYHKIFVLDLDGRVVRSFGKRGSDPGEFNYPVAVAFSQDRLYVVDAMNFRIQILDLAGRALGQVGRAGDGSGTFSKPKSIALDSEGHLYVVDSFFEVVQIFDQDGRFLLDFGGTGSDSGQFQLPTGIFIDPADRIYVADSYNSRVQVFQYLKAKEPNQPEAQ